MFLKVWTSGNGIFLFIFPGNNDITSDVKSGKMPISGIKNSAKKETFGSKLNFSIGGTLLKPPISKSSILIFSLQFYRDLGEQKANENLIEPKFPSTLPKAFLKPNPQSKSV